MMHQWLSGTDIVASLKALPGTKAALKRVDQHLQKNPWGVLPIESDAKGKKAKRIGKHRVVG